LKIGFGQRGIQWLDLLVASVDDFAYISRRVFPDEKPTDINGKHIPSLSQSSCADHL
jgi:hypothetical protein